MHEDTQKRPLILHLERCHGCMGCAELCPAVVGWDEDNERPFLKRLEVTEGEIQEAMACCPKDCFEFSGE
ncbi:MAG: ferredoxin [Desulfovibrio sp.]